MWRSLLKVILFVRTTYKYIHTYIYIYLYILHINQNSSLHKLWWHSKAVEKFPLMPTYHIPIKATELNIICNCTIKCENKKVVAVFSEINHCWEVLKSDLYRRFKNWVWDGMTLTYPSNVFVQKKSQKVCRFDESAIKIAFIRGSLLFNITK